MYVTYSKLGIRISLNQERELLAHCVFYVRPQKVPNCTGNIRA